MNIFSEFYLFIASILKFFARLVAVRIEILRNTMWPWVRYNHWMEEIASLFSMTAPNCFYSNIAFFLRRFQWHSKLFIFVFMRFDFQYRRLYNTDWKKYIIASLKSHDTNFVYSTFYYKSVGCDCMTQNVVRLS